jgi:hypothetical protein
MSIYDYLFDNDWLQRRDIEGLKATSQGLAHRIVKQNRTLEEHIAHLTLVHEALLRMLEKKGLLTREEFRTFLVEADKEEALEGEKPAAPPKHQLPAVRCRFCMHLNAEQNRYCSQCRRPLLRV